MYDCRYTRAYADHEVNDQGFSGRLALGWFPLGNILLNILWRRVFMRASMKREHLRRAAMSDRKTSNEPLTASTRRQIITAVVLGAIGFCTNEAWATNGQAISRAQKSIHQKTILEARRDLVHLGTA